MNFLYPLAFLGLITIPVVIFIYFFHRRFKPRIVSAVFLWPGKNVVTGSGIKLSKLIKNFLLLIEIIMFIILVLAAAGPYCSNINTVSNITFILDTSASMGAVDKNGETARQRAVEEISRYVKGNAPYNVELIISGFIPRPVSMQIRNEGELKIALDDWLTDNIYHSLIPAINTAEQITPENGSIIVITDSKPEKETNEDIRFWFFGKELFNTGITQAIRKSEYSGINETVFAIVRNFSDENKTVTIKLLEEDIVLIEKHIELKSGGVETPVFFEIERRNSTLQLMLDIEDPLPIDNFVYLVPEENYQVPVKLILKDSELELSIRNILEVFNSRIVYKENEPALIITDMEIELSEIIPGHGGGEGEDPAEDNLENSMWILEFKNIPEKNYYGPFVIDKSHPFTRELMLDGVRWSAVSNIEDGYPVISSGNTPLLVEKNIGNNRNNRNNNKHFIINIHLGTSNIEETLNWPIFFSNLIKNRIENLSGIKARNNIMGETALAVYNNINSLEIQSEDSVITEIEREGNIFPISSEKQGIYKVIIDEEEVYKISFLFLSDEESDLRNLSTGLWGTPPDNIESEHTRTDNIGWLLLLFVILLFVLHLYIQRRYGKD